MPPASSDPQLQSLASVPQPQAFVAHRIAADADVDVGSPGHWLPLAQAGLSLDDWGTLQGATLVERLRTVHGEPLDIQAHLDRLQASAQVLGIVMPKYLTCKLIEQCVHSNRDCYAQPDFAVVILLTPGHLADRPAGSHPTVIVHTTPLNWAQLSHWYQHGQALITGLARNVPGHCWSPHIKTRSRLHYYLADSEATASGLPFAGAAMLSIDGFLTESSVANLMIVRDGVIVAPPPDTVLQGLSLQRTLRLAQGLGVSVVFRSFRVQEAQQAEALFMTGSSGCLWPASQLDHVPFPGPTKHPLYERLRDAWCADLGLDYVAQAQSLTESRR